jgi:hypothetical protein
MKGIFVAIRVIVATFTSRGINGSGLIEPSAWAVPDFPAKGVAERAPFAWVQTGH